MLRSAVQQNFALSGLSALHHYILLDYSIFLCGTNHNNMKTHLSHQIHIESRLHNLCLNVKFALSGGRRPHESVEEFKPRTDQVGVRTHDHSDEELEPDGFAELEP